jgi:catechol 2,3-dioxygenase-like lactoylglutathione lyase family enzyme
MSVLGLDHVQVAAPREPGVEERARAFYGALLGLAEIEKPEALRPRGGVWFSLGRGELHVGLEDDFRPARKAHPALAVVGLDELRARLEAAGHATSGAEEIPGTRRFYVSDPFGNRLELIERMEVPW